MSHGGIEILSEPGQDGSTIDEQITSHDQSTEQDTSHFEHEEGLNR